MATENLQIPDIQASQNQKEVTANAAHNLLDRAMNGKVSIAMSSGTNNLTDTQQRENFVLELTGTPGAPYTLEMADTNQRVMAVVNNSDDVVTVKNPSAGGSGQPVIAVGEASIFHFDGTNFFDLSALALSVAAWLGLTDTPSSFSGQSGMIPTVNNAETALEFIKTAIKLPVRAATTGALTLADDFETSDVIDGVTLATNDRILIKDQADGAENGIYYVQSAAPPIRVEDFDDAVDVEGGVMVTCQEGSINADTVFVLTNNGTVTPGSTSLVFSATFAPATNFTILTDTPANYTDQDGKSLRVTDAEDAVEFVPQAWKDPVRAATTAALTLASDFEPTDVVDGITLAEFDRILIKDQASAIENGLYIVASSGAPTRAPDLNDNTDIVLGSMVHVLLGTANANTTWEHTAGSDLGVDNQDFTELEAADQAYTDLTDTPADFTDQDGKSLRVTDAEDAVEFVPQAWKDPVRLATTAALTLASDLEGGTDSLDGVALVVGDRVLVKDQASNIENGLYDITSGAPTRTIDLNDNSDIVLGAMVHVLLGTDNANTTWEHTAGTDLDVDGQDFTELEAADQALLDLTDAPSVYTNTSGMDVRVNAAADGVEFVARTWKEPVRIATIADISLTGEQTLDGVLTSTDRVLVKAQSSADENGIYVTAAGAWARAIDFDNDADAIEGAVIPVIDGDVGAKTSWMHTTTGAITIGSTNLTFAKMQPERGFVPLVLGGLRLLSTDQIAGLLDDTTTPSFERIDGATDKGLRVLWGLSNNDEVAFPEVYMPPDFNSDVDITIHIVGEMSGATDTPTIDVLVFDSSGDTEMGGVTATFTDTRAEKTVTITAANLTGHPLGWLSISLIPVGAHATDTLAIFSAWIEYTRKTA